MQPAAHSCGWCCCSRIFQISAEYYYKQLKEASVADAGGTFAGDLLMHLCVVVVASHL
jgi:hypothetical protein